MKRIAHLQQKLEELGVAAFYVDSPVDLFYLTGLELSAGVLIVALDSAELFVDGRYLEHCKEHAPVPVTPLSDDALSKALKAFRCVGVDSSLITLEKSEKLKRWTQLEPQSRFLQALRAVKDESEMSALRRAASLACRGLSFVQSHLEEGSSERKIARELEIFWLKAGGERLSFDPIIAFGPNSALPHHHSAETQLKSGMAVLVDLGVQESYYQSDMTRVIAFGPLDARMAEIYGIVKGALEAALKVCRAGVSAAELDKAARQIIEDAGYGEFFPHSLGHGVGLEVHEWPTIKQDDPFGLAIIEAGMVITIEPGIYLPHVGGVRLEHTVVVREGEPEILTTYPVESVLNR